jgi:hypothetical protein
MDDLIPMSRQNGGVFIGDMRYLIRDVPPRAYFFLDKKVGKKSRPTEIRLINLGNS